MKLQSHQSENLILEVRVCTKHNVEGTDKMRAAGGHSVTLGWIYVLLDFWKLHRKLPGTGGKQMSVEARGTVTAPCGLRPLYVFVGEKQHNCYANPSGEALTPFPRV